MANIWKKFKHFKMGQPGLFFHCFGLFRQILQFLWQIYVKKCPSNIQCQDSNQWPSKHESPPTTTRPGLPPNLKLFIPTSRHTAPRPFHYFSNSYLFPVRIKFPPLPDLHKKWKKYHSIHKRLIWWNKLTRLHQEIYFNTDHKCLTTYDGLAGS